MAMMGRGILMGVEEPLLAKSEVTTGVSLDEPTKAHQ